MYLKFSRTKHQRLHVLWRQLRVLVTVQVARRTEEAFADDRQVALRYLTEWYRCMTSPSRLRTDSVAPAPWPGFGPPR